MDWTQFDHLTRASAPQVATERDMLRGWLDFHRMTLFGKLRGLDDTQLTRRAVPPSAMSLLGLLRAVALGEDVTYLYGDGTPLGGDFDGVDTADIGADIQLWIDACADSRRIEASIDTLDAPVHELWPGQGPATLRWVMVHMIEEYARHNGHADLLREVIDGATGY
jgi:hypothetical protein